MRSGFDKETLDLNNVLKGEGQLWNFVAKAEFDVSQAYFQSLMQLNSKRQQQSSIRNLLQLITPVQRYLIA